MTFREHLEDTLFVLSSDNYRYIQESHLYGYCFTEKKFLRDCVINTEDSISIDSPGCFIAIINEPEQLRIIQDGTSFFQLYFYHCDDYWAVSNSFWKLCDYLKPKHKLTLDEIYCEQFISSGVSPLTLKRTLANEIEILPPRTEIRINETFSLIEHISDLIDKTPVNSQEAMALVDKWVSKWATIIRSIYDAGFKIKLDLSGGYDSRVSLALALASGIDLNSDQVIIYSRGPSKVYGDEDWEIASAIADHFSFSIQSKYDVENAVHLSGRDRFEINRLILSNCHREPYFPGAYYEKPVFYLNGLAGENVRGWKQRDDFLTFFKNPYGQSSIHYIPVIAQRELLEDWDKLPVFNKVAEINEKERNRYYMMAVRSRNHFGVVALQNYLLNYIQVPNFNDIDILRIGLVEGIDPVSLFTIILHRTCPDLLEFPVEGKRSFPQNGRELAKRLADQYPPHISISQGQVDFSGAVNDKNLCIDSQVGQSPESILDYLFDDKEGAMLFKERFGQYGEVLYDDAKNNRANKNLPFPRQYESVIVAIINMLRVEKESYGEISEKLKTSRYYGDNRFMLDSGILSELSEQYPEVSILERELKKSKSERLRNVLLVNKLDESIDESIDRISKCIDYFVSYPDEYESLVHEFHLFLRKVLLSDQLSSIPRNMRATKKKQIRRLIRKLPDMSSLKQNSLSMKLYVDFGFDAFSHINYLKRIFRK